MYLFLFIGRPGTGKSQSVKEYIKNKPCFIFDVNNEYPGLSTDRNKPRSKDTVLDMEVFINVCSKKTNTVCVFEDATGYFKGLVGRKLVQTIQQRRHSKNVFIFLFHSIGAIPPEIKNFASFYKLFKTNDTLEEVRKKNTALIPYFLDVRNNKDPKYLHKTTDGYIESHYSLTFKLN